MAESDLRNGIGTDSHGNEVTMVTVRKGGKLVTVAVRSSGNREQDEERARRAAGSINPQDSDHLRGILGNGS